MITADFVLRIFGHIFFLFLVICVPPFLTNVLKAVRHGANSANAPYENVEWISLIVLYALAIYLYVFKWLLAH